MRSATPGRGNGTTATATGFRSSTQQTVQAKVLSPNTKVIGGGAAFPSSSSPSPSSSSSGNLGAARAMSAAARPSTATATHSSNTTTTAQQRAAAAAAAAKVTSTTTTPSKSAAHNSHNNNNHAATQPSRALLLDFPLTTPNAASSSVGGRPSTSGSAATANNRGAAMSSSSSSARVSTTTAASGGGGRPLTARSGATTAAAATAGGKRPATSTVSTTTKRVGGGGSAAVSGSGGGGGGANTNNNGNSNQYQSDSLNDSMTDEYSSPYAVPPAILSAAQQNAVGHHSALATGIPSIKFRSDFDKQALRFAANQHGLFEVVGGTILSGEVRNERDKERNLNANTNGGGGSVTPRAAVALTGGSSSSNTIKMNNDDIGDSPTSPALSLPQQQQQQQQQAATTRNEWGGLHLNSYNGPWNFFWASVQQVRAMFDPSTAVRLRDDQIINHFPNHVELTRKDLMYKNLRRYLRENTSARGGGNGTVYGTSADGPTNPATGRRLTECVPVTFSLPNDLSLFTEEYKKTPGSTWIIKPSNRSQGKGIFLINRFAQLQSWLREKAEEGDRDPYIASRYVARPLLIAGKKFDLRLYVLVLNYKPLVAYFHEEGFARFCTTLYTEPKSNVDISEEPLGAHLTNVAFQKGEEEYNDHHGGKWTLKNLWLFIEGAFGHAEATAMLSDIQFLILNTLLSVQNVVHNDKHAFELYGYDILLDDELRPHLIEVNASPSLRVTTTGDRMMKGNVLLDTFRLVCPVTRQPCTPPQSTTTSATAGGGGNASTTPVSPSPSAAAATKKGVASPTSASSSLPTVAPPPAAAHNPNTPPFIFTPACAEYSFADYKRRPDLQAPHVGGFHLIDSGGR